MLTSLTITASYLGSACAKRTVPGLVFHVLSGDVWSLDAHIPGGATVAHTVSVPAASRPAVAGSGRAIWGEVRNPSSTLRSGPPYWTRQGAAFSTVVPRMTIRRRHSLEGPGQCSRAPAAHCASIPTAGPPPRVGTTATSGAQKRRVCMLRFSTNPRARRPSH